MLAPEIPLPMITVSAYSGSSSVLLKEDILVGGSRQCQYEAVGFGRGRVGTMEARASILKADEDCRFVSKETRVMRVPLL